MIVKDMRFMRLPGSYFVLSIGLLFLLLLVSCESEADIIVNDSVININNDNESINITGSINVTEIKQDCVTQRECWLPNSCIKKMNDCVDDRICVTVPDDCQLKEKCFGIEENTSCMNITSCTNKTTCVDINCSLYEICHLEPDCRDETYCK